MSDFVTANRTMRQWNTHRHLAQHFYVWRWSALAILLLGFLIRVHTLAAHALWFDESMEFWVASAPLNTLLDSVKNGIQDPPLYSLLLHFWMTIGQGEFWLRFLSVALSLLSMAGVVLLGRQLLNRPVSLIAGLLMALSAPDIRFAQEAGQYALMICLTTLSLVFLRAASLRGTWRWWLTWGAVATAGIYGHYGTAIIVLTCALLALTFNLVKKRKADLVRQSGALMLIGLLLIPLLFDFLPAQLFRGGTKQAFTLSLGTAGAEFEQFLVQSQELLLYQEIGEPYMPWPWPAIPQWGIWLLGLIALAAAASKPHSAVHPFTLLAASWLLYYLIARVGAYPFGHRYSVFLTPLFAITGAAGIHRVWRVRPVFGALLLGSLLAISIMAPAEGQEDLRSISAIWARLHQPGDVTYVYYGAVPGFRYQLSLKDNQALQVPPLWYTTCWKGQPEPYCIGQDIIYGRWIRRLSPEEKRADILAQIGPATGRLWLIASHIASGEDHQIINALRPEYAVTAVYEAANASTHLLERR